MRLSGALLVIACVLPASIARGAQEEAFLDDLRHWFELARQRPDLVVEGFDVEGAETLNSGSREQLNGRTYLVVQATVTVKNAGRSTANRFKVSVHYRGLPIAPTEWFVVAFSLDEESSVFYPFTSGRTPSATVAGELPPGVSATFRGKLVFSEDHAGREVSLKAIADSCSGDEFMPSYCRVWEYLETNNESAVTTITLTR